MANRPSCRGCKFVQTGEGLGFGECRYHAPTPGKQEDGHFRADWPIIDPEVDWCGKWEKEGESVTNWAYATPWVHAIRS